MWRRNQSTFVQNTDERCIIKKLMIKTERAKPLRFLWFCDGLTRFFFDTLLLAEAAKQACFR